MTKMVMCTSCQSQSAVVVVPKRDGERPENLCLSCARDRGYLRHSRTKRSDLVSGKRTRK